MKIRRHYISTKPLDDYYQIISDIKADESIPKYASNLVYVNHAGKEGTVALGLDTSMVVVERVPLIPAQQKYQAHHADCGRIGRFF